MEQTKTALLVMDFQNPIVGMIANPEDLLNKTSAVIAKARGQNIPVIYVVVGFRQGMPEISRNNAGFDAVKEKMANADMQAWTIIHNSITPQQDDIVITKRRVSAFTGSDLEVVLRAQNIRHIVLTGIATGGVVLSTLREAADKDYQITVIADCCADGDEEVHRILTEKVFPKQADVISSNNWLN